MAKKEDWDGTRKKPKRLEASIETRLAAPGLDETDSVVAPDGEEAPAAEVSPNRTTTRRGWSWETIEGARTSYVEVQGPNMLVGAHSGSGHTDSAATCTREEFLNGRFHSAVRSDHGEAVLQEIITALKG